MDISQTSSSADTTSPSRRSSIPIPKRKSSLHLYIANSIVGPSNSSSPSSASSTHEDHANEFGGSSAVSPSHSASSSRSATAMSMHSSLYVPRSGSSTATEFNFNDYLQLRENHNRLINKCEKITKRNQNLESSTQLLKKIVAALQVNIGTLQKERTEFIDKNRKLRRKLSEIVPSGDGTASSDDEESEKSSKTESQSSDQANLATESKPPAKEGEIDSLLNEMEKLKSYLNNVELQLYEANEKISELQESKQQSEETNTKLLEENAELIKVARLMSANMLDSIDTSNRLESSYIQVRRERDNLVRHNRDSVDSKTGPNEEIQKMRSEMELKRKTFEAQFIEYKSLMDQELSRNTNDQIITLQLEVDRLKQDLEEALNRAERAEEEARELRQQLRINQLPESQFYSQLDLDKLSLRGDGDNESLLSYVSGSVVSAALPVTAPPPPPPPVPPPPPPPPMAAVTGTGFLGLGEAISTQKLNHVGIEHVNSRQQQATGLDSVIADIKSGRVTLRRRKHNVLKELEDGDHDTGGFSSSNTPTNRNKSRQSQQTYSQLAAQNPALREMYEILERMKRRNRQSKVIVESELVPFGDSNSNGSDVGKLSEEEGFGIKSCDATDGSSSRRQTRTVITGIVDV